MVNRNRMIDAFRTLTAFDSESFHEKEIADHLEAKLRELGTEVKRDNDGNIYAFLKGNAGGEPILFSAHMDTVSPGVGKKAVFHDSGKVTSDGRTVLGADDVTGIVAILEMLEVIKEKRLSHPDIEAVFFVAEEVYGLGSANFDYSQIKARKAYVLDLDGPVGRIANRAPSIVQFEIRIEGKSAHAGFEPEKGISALQIAARGIDGLKLGRIDEKTTANIGVISGGTGKNIIPGEVKLEGEVRSLDDEAALAYIEKIKERFETVSGEFGGKCFFTSKRMIKAFHTESDSEVIRKYADALHALGYGEPVIVTTFGGSDNNNLALHGIEGIVISNAMNLVHTVNEYFYVDELVKSAEIVLRLGTK